MILEMEGAIVAKKMILFVIVMRIVIPKVGMIMVFVNLPRAQK